MTRSRLMFTGLSFFLFLNIGGLGAYGQGKRAKPEPSKMDKKKAEEYHTLAVSLFEESKYEEAIGYFQMAHELDSNPFSLFNIAKAYDKLYKYKQAHDFYQKYLLTGDKAKMDESLEAMAEIEKMPVILKVITIPEGAEVFVDGEKVEAQLTPVIHETLGGKHRVLIVKEGFEDIEQDVEVPYGGELKLKLSLEPAEEKPVIEPLVEKKEEKKEEKKKKKKAIPVSLSLAAGATVSTTDTIGSFIDVSLALFFRIRQGYVGLGIDNLIFADSYILTAYPAGGYSVKVHKNLYLDFSAGFGFAYLYAADDGGDGEGNVLLEAGSHWDLVAHADIKISYKIGSFVIQFIPVHVNVLIGVGSIEPAPLAQFAFLAGIAYDF